MKSPSKAPRDSISQLAPRGRSTTGEMMLTSVVCPPWTKGTKATPPETTGTVGVPLASGAWAKACVDRQNDRQNRANHRAFGVSLNVVMTSYAAKGLCYLRAIPAPLLIVVSH